MPMGLTFSCPAAGHDSLDESLKILVKSLNLSNDYVKSTIRSVSFNGRDSKPALKAWGSGKLIVKNSLSFNKRDTETCTYGPKFSKKSPTSPKKTLENADELNNSKFASSIEKISEADSPKHEAAVKLQKVYKSFRTRRQLADCAVLVEQRWWKLLDFAMLKRSSVSFFEISKTESAVSKWSRAKSRAAKVGKGLSKDEKARKLALQHWLEAIDPRHRYGHNLHFYYNRWLRCESKQPFFYWLDIGDGKEVNDEKCPRPKLQQQCIKYLGPKEREEYEVAIEDGKILRKKSGELLDTTSEDSKDSKWIFVLSTSKNLYVGQKKKGIFQHSSFLAGGATSAAGRLEIERGILKAIWPHSGHYRPTEENFQEFVAYLESRNVDLTDVKKSPSEGDDEEMATVLRPSRSELDLTRRITEQVEEKASTDSAKPGSEEEESTRMKKPVADDSDESEEEEEAVNRKPTNDHSVESKLRAGVTSHGSSNTDMFRKPNLFAGEQDEEETRLPSELILRRMNFRKQNLSLQLGKQLHCTWTTGAGPRIGYVSDSPSELRFRALEEVNLSPKGNLPPRDWASPAKQR